LGDELRGGVLRGEFGQRHDDCIIGERGGRGSEGWARTAKQKQEGNDDGIARLKLFKSDNFWCHGQRMWVICARSGMQITYTAQSAVRACEGTESGRVGRERDRDGKGKASQSRAEQTAQQQ
jgi:hypothetical protein